MDSTKNIQIHIPSKIQEKIDDGTYRLRGTQVRDQKGRIVRNLEALEVDKDYYFSPQIFVQFEQYTFISNSVVSFNLQKALKAVKFQLFLFLMSTFLVLLKEVL